jgi:hypothetical protein
MTSPRTSAAKPPRRPLVRLTFSVHALRYRDLSITWTTQIVARKEPNLARSLHAATARWNHQVFEQFGSDTIKSYDLPGSKFKATISTSGVQVEGELKISVTQYVTKIVSLNITALINRPEHLDTDELISLGGAVTGLEATEFKNDEEATLHANHATVTLINRGDNSETSLNDFIEDFLQRLGTTWVTRADYVTYDIWETLGDQTEKGLEYWTQETSTAVVSHLESTHAAELMGILTLYPGEWRFRDPRYFRAVCGGNIAIDVDDLVLVSERCALILGSYALRSGESDGTNWGGGVLAAERNETGLSWPEFALILDAGRAKRTALKAARRLVTESAISLRGEALANISSIALSATTDLWRIEEATVPRFPAHTMMLRSTEARLGVSKERELLSRSVEILDLAIANLDSVAAAGRDRRLGRFAIFISLGSIIQVLFLNADIPVLRQAISQETVTWIAKMVVATMVVGGTVFGFYIAFYKFAIFSRGLLRRRNKENV